MNLMDNIFGGYSYAERAGMSREEWKAATKFGGVDMGWIVMNIGMSIGAGIVFLPVQVGLSGLYIYLIVALVSYPIMYSHQKLYLNVLAESPKCEDFAGIISGYLGKNVGLFLGVLYFMFTAILLFLYSTALNNDSASFLQSFGVTEGLLSENIFYGLAILCFLVLIASQSEKLIMKIASGMVITKVLAVVAIAFVMMQYWDLGNIYGLPDLKGIIVQCIILLPLISLSIAFFAGLGPVVIYYRNHTENRYVAHFRAMRTYNVAFFFLFGLVFFYTVSFNLAINHDMAVHAFKANISALALAASNMSGFTVKILGLILNIFAVVTAFFAIFLSFRDSCTGIVANILKRVMPEDKINRKAIKYGTSVFCVAICWGTIVLNVPVLHFASMTSPLVGIIGCLLPAYLVISREDFKRYRSWMLIPIIAMGLFLLASPFLALS